MKKILALVLLVISVAFGKLFAQTELEEWDWQWGKKPEIYNSYRALGIRTDFYNNSYSYHWYIDSITIGDTSFIHHGGIPSRQDFNLAIVKHNSKGEQVNVIDIYTPQDESIWTVDIEIDQESNLFICGTFRDTLSISNTLLTTNTPGRNLFILKLTSDFQFLWANTITGYGQNDCAGFEISEDNSLYLSVKHHGVGYDSTVCMINFLNQDSALVENGLNSLLKIDSDGNLLWRKELRDMYQGYSSYIKNTFIGNNGRVYVIGHSTYNIIIDGDTLYHPDYPNYGDNEKLFIASFDEQGVCLNSFFIDIDHFSIYYWDIEVDSDNNYYLSGTLWENTIWGGDTIIIPENRHAKIITKMDSAFNPIWIHHVIDDQINFWFFINLIGNKIAFSTSGMGTFSFGDVNFTIENHFQVILGLFDSKGQLVSYQITETTEGANVFSTEIDNCGNFLITGYFEDKAYFGSDTIMSELSNEYYFAKNYRGNPLPLDMPKDTSDCSELTLYAPEGYLYYKWNDVVLEQDWMLITESMEVNLAVANDDGCWSECDISVSIYPEIVFTLGVDTTITLTDTFELNVENIYSSYLWSTGDTMPNIKFPASDLQLGENQIWLEIQNGPCSASDSINVFVIDNSSIEEYNKNGIQIYPNPADKTLKIINKDKSIIKSVIIYDLMGQKKVFTKPTNETIDLENLKSGTYIIEVITDQMKTRRKLIIN